MRPATACAIVILPLSAAGLMAAAPWDHAIDQLWCLP